MARKTAKSVQADYKNSDPTEKSSGYRRMDLLDIQQRAGGDDRYGVVFGLPPTILFEKRDAMIRGV